MSFFLILTENHNHPTSHLLLMTQVIGSEALVEVTTAPPPPLPSSVTACWTSRPLGWWRRMSWEGVAGWRGYPQPPAARQTGPQLPGFPPGHVISPQPTLTISSALWA